MSSNWQVISGVVQPGHMIASGQSQDSPYPGGSIELQIPHFEALGLDLAQMFRGTLNVSIAPYQFSLKQPAYTFCQVQWTTKHQPEDFSFSACEVKFKGLNYSAWIYYPHPETKTRHFQDRSTLEILAPLIPGIQYGDLLEISINPAEIAVLPA